MLYIQLVKANGTNVISSARELRLLMCSVGRKSTYDDSFDKT